jgi:transposase
MPFQSTRARLLLSVEDRATLDALGCSRTESRQHVERARIMLRFAAGDSVSLIAREMNTSRPRVERCLNKALQLGVTGALADIPGRGRPRVISEEDRAWVIGVACQKPKELGYPHELWTNDLLTRHLREWSTRTGHPALAQVGGGTVSRILMKREIRPHKIQYYLERRDPEFDRKMAEVLCVYREVALFHQRDNATDTVAVLSYDEKPGIQAIGTTAPDLPPVPGRHSSIGRDHEYVRHGTVSLMAAIDLMDGRVHGQVVDRHRSREFIGVLRQIDGVYAKGVKIRIILDNHSAHISRETRTYLATMPNRFEFIFTPKHGSWLNLIEMFFSKLARSMLRGIRVADKAELKQRILQYLEMVNQDPVIFRWKFGLGQEAAAVTG